MSERARWVLQDCKQAFARHTQELQGEDFRISWVAIVSLLRAVGHVLNKVDRNTNREMAKAIDTQWKKLKHTKPEPLIFWEFIDKHRNNVLKQYQLGVSRGIEIKGPTVDGRQTIIKIDHANQRGGKGYSYGAEHYSHITSGPFVGRNEKDVIREAIEWWEQYLNEIDQLAKKEKTITRI